MSQKSLFTIIKEASEALYLIEKECIMDENEKLFFHYMYKFLDDVEARYNMQFYRQLYSTEMSKEVLESAKKFHDFLTDMQNEHAKLANVIAQLIKK